MASDIDQALEGWDYNPGNVQARVVQAHDGREVLQLRIDLGILQLETTDRPDGAKPNGQPTYLRYLQHEAAQTGQPFTLSDEQCEEADREFLQFYHRRLCWLALHRFAEAVRDADHTLAFMDFLRDHSPAEEYVQTHEQYRGFVLFHRTQAAAGRAVSADDPEGAIDAIADGLTRLRDFFVDQGAEEKQMEEHEMVRQLRRMERSLRSTHGIEETLREQLDRAVANEEYETAARIRDVLRRRTEPS